ncbi:MAG: hypothetical protein R2748_10500 [Bryobacterales bacterium]
MAPSEVTAADYHKRALGSHLIPRQTVLVLPRHHGHAARDRQQPHRGSIRWT